MTSITKLHSTLLVSFKEPTAVFLDFVSSCCDFGTIRIVIIFSGPHSDISPPNSSLFGEKHEKHAYMYIW